MIKNTNEFEQKVVDTTFSLRISWSVTDWHRHRPSCYTSWLPPAVEGWSVKSQDINNYFFYSSIVECMWIKMNWRALVVKVANCVLSIYSLVSNRQTAAVTFILEQRLACFLDGALFDIALYAGRGRRPYHKCGWNVVWSEKHEIAAWLSPQVPNYAFLRHFENWIWPQKFNLNVPPVNFV